MIEINLVDYQAACKTDELTLEDGTKVLRRTILLADSQSPGLVVRLFALPEAAEDIAFMLTATPEEMKEKQALNEARAKIAVPGLPMNREQRRAAEKAGVLIHEPGTI